MRTDAPSESPRTLACPFPHSPLTLPLPSAGPMFPESVGNPSTFQCPKKLILQESSFLASSAVRLHYVIVV